MIKLCVLLLSLLTADGVLSYSFQFAGVGENVTLRCVYASSPNAQYLSWYRQSPGEQPQLISSSYKSSKANTFYNQFENNNRFSMDLKAGCYDLKILNVQQTDSSIYYCGKTHVTTTEFDNGTFLLLNETVGVSVQQQNVTDSVVVGDSITLNCTVHNVTTSKHHEVYWFKKDPRGHLGVLYVHTNPGRCVQSWGSEQSCTYSLQKNLVHSDTGMYYCAVAVCGEILFGKGTRVGRVDRDLEDYSIHILMSCAIAVLSASVLLNIILICAVCKMWRKSSNVAEDSNIQTSVPGYTVEPQNSEGDAVAYVALDFKKKQNNRRRQRSTEEETVYSAVVHNKSAT